MHILISIVSADLTKKQLDKYWEVSRAQHMFIYVKKKLERELFLMLGTKKENAGIRLRDEITLFVNNPKYFSEYKNIFISMNPAIYNKLLKFYDIPIGKKYRKISKTIENMWPSDVKNLYYKIIKNKSISKEKIKIISSIDKELNLVDIKVNNANKIIILQRQVLYPKDNITDEMIIKTMKRYKKTTERYESMVMPVLFQDFSKEELKKILEYASNKILAIEVEYIYEAALKFRLETLKDMKSNLKKLATIKFCQDYPNKRGYVPATCKPEWLSTVSQKTK